MGRGSLHSRVTHPGVHCRRDSGRGMSVEEILTDYPDLEADDVRQALQYAADAVRERELPLRLGA